MPKEKHGMRYTQYRGLKKVRMELNLLFACMNLKKLATWLDRLGKLPTYPTKNRGAFLLICKIWLIYSKVVLAFENPKTTLSTV